MKEPTNKGPGAGGRFPNDNNALAASGETRPDEAGSRAGEAIASTLRPPPDPHEERVEKR